MAGQIDTAKTLKIFVQDAHGQERVIDVKIVNNKIVLDKGILAPGEHVNKIVENGVERHDFEIANSHDGTVIQIQDNLSFNPTNSGQGIQGQGGDSLTFHGVQLPGTQTSGNINANANVDAAPAKLSNFNMNQGSPNVVNGFSGPIQMVDGKGMDQMAGTMSHEMGKIVGDSKMGFMGSVGPMDTFSSFTGGNGMSPMMSGPMMFGTGGNGMSPMMSGPMMFGTGGNGMSPMMSAPMVSGPMMFGTGSNGMSPMMSGMGTSMNFSSTVNNIHVNIYMEIMFGRMISKVKVFLLYKKSICT